MQKVEEKGPSKDDTTKDKDRKRKREYVKVTLTQIQFECNFFQYIKRKICVLQKFDAIRIMKRKL